jgi:hypothetical protein
MKPRRALRIFGILAVLVSPLAMGQTGATSQTGRTVKPQKLSASAIQIEPIEAGDISIPAEFRYAIYERLVERVRKDGAFQKVYRSGDQEANNVADLVTLRTKVGKFTEGSQMRRELTTVSGGTTVDVITTVAARDGHVLFESDLSGKVRFFGENLGVTNDLAKRIAKLLRERF